MTDTDLLPCLIRIANALEYNSWTKQKAASELDKVIKELRTPSSTRANERGDLSDFIKHKQQVIERQMEKHTPQPSPQSDMVAVPREVITDLQGTLNYIAVQGKANHPGFAQVARMNAEDAVKRLQPYTKGE